MITKSKERENCLKSREIIHQTGMVFNEHELDSMVAADFGLGRLDEEGLQVLTFMDTDQIGAKVIVLLSGQTMLEHWHPKRSDDIGKEETLRCLFGQCRVYIPGLASISEGYIPEGQADNYKCRHEMILEKTDQITFPPGTPHWFQAGEGGCAVLSLSSKVTDSDDQFTNPDVVRKTVYVDE